MPKITSEIVLLGDLKPGDLVALAKCDAQVVHVNKTLEDDGKNTKELITLDYVPCFKVTKGQYEKKSVRQLTSFACDGTLLMVEKLPARKQRWWHRKATA